MRSTILFGRLIAVALALSGYISGTVGYAQTLKYTFSGYVRDSANGEELIGASVAVVELKTGISTNSYGFYSLTLPAGKYRIRYSMIGYNAKELEIMLDQSVRTDVELVAHSVKVDSVTVTDQRAGENSQKTEMGTTTLSPAQTQSIPVLFGEQDIIKALELTPGVQEMGEGNTGFTVRGGGPDQNLILLDEATVYNASHLLGFFSVFNSDAIREARLIKGAGSAEYGGRLSSVLDIKLKEGNGKGFEGNAGIGIIASRLALQGPIARDRSSFIISGRRTYFDLFLKASSDESVRKSSLYFYDLNIKANYRAGANDRFYLSGYFGRDVLGYKGEFGVDWGNSTATARWNHLFNNRMFLNTSLILSTYSYKVGIVNGDELVDIKSWIRDINLKEDLQLFVGSGNSLKFGLHATHHTFLPGDIETSASAINELRLDRKYALEGALYASHEITVNERLSVEYGARYSGFVSLGPGDVYTFDEFREPVDTQSYGSAEVIASFEGIEPRVIARYQLTDESSVKAAVTRNRQYMHLLSTSTTTTPFDVWYPSTKLVKPGIADQYSIGYFRDFAGGKYESSVETYYKNLRDQIDYRNGADIFFNELVEAELVFGKARAYGVEFLVRRNTGRLTGWVGYTLSRTEKQFEEINEGAWFPARQDRTHDLEIVGIYELSRRWTFGFNWVYYTGNAVTFPSGKYVVEGTVINLYSDRNAYRMPDYHRLDLNFTLKGKRTSWNFSLYNAYGRRNAYAINFRTLEDDHTKTEAVRIALFSFFPAVAFNMEF